MIDVFECARDWRCVHEHEGGKEGLLGRVMWFWGCVWFSAIGNRSSMFRHCVQKRLRYFCVEVEANREVFGAGCLM